MFSMNDVYVEQHKYDCREIVFGGWDAATIQYHNQGLNWGVFSSPKKSEINQPIPIDFEKPYHPTIVKFKNCNMPNRNESDNYTNSILKACPRYDSTPFMIKSRQSTSLSSRTPRIRQSPLPTNFVYDLTPKLNKRPQTVYSLNLNQNEQENDYDPLAVTTRSYNPSPSTNRKNIFDDDDQKKPDQVHILSLNQMIQMRGESPATHRSLKGDDPSKCPFRVSMKILDEYATEEKQKKKKKSKSKLTVTKKTPPKSSLSVVSQKIPSVRYSYS